MNINAYFDHINTDEFIIFISVYDEASKQWANFKHASRLGLKHSPQYRESYLAVIDTQNKYTYEKSGSSLISYDYNLADGNVVKLSSCGYRIEPEISEIIIEGHNFSHGKRGVNFVFYNKKLGKVYDCFFVDFFADPELNVCGSLKEFNVKMTSIERGWKIADKYCDYDNSVFYYVLYRHMGDANRVLRGLRAVKEYYGSESKSKYHFDNRNNFAQKFKKTKFVKKLYIISSYANSGVAKLYSNYIDGVIALDNADIKDLCAYAASSCALHQNIICDEDMQRMVWNRWRTDEGQYVRGLMFGITYMEWDFAIPHGMEQATPTIPMESIKEAEKFIDENNLIPDKTIIIAPMALSSTLLDNTIWEKYASILKEKHYKIFTNTGKGEVAINGTERLFYSVDVVAALAQKGIRIIGIQSGFTDIIADVVPQVLTVLFLVGNEIGRDEQFARNRGVRQNGITVSSKGIRYIKTENHNEDHVLSLLLDGFD